MPNESDNQKRIDMMLIRESVWKIEDRLNVISESIVDQEADLIRLKRLVDLALERLGKLEAARTKTIHTITQ